MSSLKGELLAARRHAAAAENLKHEVLILDKQLLREQNKTKALSEELETPLNVHRYCAQLLIFSDTRINTVVSAIAEPSAFNLNPRLIYSKLHSFSPLSLQESILCRWRKLEGSDPATFELLQKVQLLHKRLIRSSEELVERDLQIKQREQLCHELQAIIKRAPSAEAGRQLLLTQVCDDFPKNHVLGCKLYANFIFPFGKGLSRKLPRSRLYF